MDLNKSLEYGIVGFSMALSTAVGLIMASPLILTVTAGDIPGGSPFVYRSVEVALRGDDLC